LNPSSIGSIAAAVAINIAALTIISAAGTVPAHTLSAMKAALVEAWAIPAIGVEANRDVLDRSKPFDRRIGTYRRAQRRRLDTALHERAGCQGGRRSKGQKKTMHNMILLGSIVRIDGQLNTLSFCSA
jgi:hypothetical protein